MNTSSRPARVAVLVSGRGSNLAALIAARDAGRLPVDFSLVASNQTAAPALGIAMQHGIEAVALSPHGHADRASYDAELFAKVAASGADFVVLAGFMRILDASVTRAWYGRMINIHPSLLPKYPGLHTHRKALAAGDTHHGASVHYVSAELDGGPVIAQAGIDILPGDDEDSLAARLLPFEHQLLPATLALMVSGRVRAVGNGIELDGKTLSHPLQLHDGKLELA